MPAVPQSPDFLLRRDLMKKAQLDVQTMCLSVPAPLPHIHTNYSLEPTTRE